MAAEADMKPAAAWLVVRFNYGSIGAVKLQSSEEICGDWPLADPQWISGVLVALLSINASTGLKRTTLELGQAVW